MAIIKRLRFRECEHYGDLDAYAHEVVKCGGHIVGKELDASREKGTVEIKVENEQEFKAFMDKFSTCDSYQFLS